METKAEQVVNLSALGQGAQRTNFGLIDYLTISLDDTVGGQTVHAVIDSIIKADTSAFTTRRRWTAPGAARGTPCLRPKAGFPISSEPTRLAAAGGQMTALLNNFFPESSAGPRWRSMGRYHREYQRTGSQTITTKTITNSSVTGRETRDGQPALKVETAFSMAQSGVLNQGGGTLSIDGTGKGTATYWVTPEGKYLGSNSTETSDLQVTADQLPSRFQFTPTTRW